MYRTIPLLSLISLGLSLQACGSDAADTSSRLETRATLSGRVLLESTPGMNDKSRVRVDLGRGEGSVSVLEDGTFLVSDLEPDVYPLRITYIGGLTATATESAYQAYTANVVADQGGSIHLGDLPLKPGTGDISGAVSRPGDTDFPADAQILLVASGSGGEDAQKESSDATNYDEVLHQAQINPDGTYSVSEVPVGHYEAVVHGEGIRGCLGIFSVAEHLEVVALDSFEVASTQVTYLPGTGQLHSQADDTTWFIKEDGLTVNMVAGFATEIRSWTGDISPGDRPSFSAFTGSRVFTAEELLSETTDVSFQFKDACGYTSQVDTLVLIRDTEAPLISTLELNNGGALSQSPSVPLTLAADDNFSSTLEMRTTLCTVDATLANPAPTDYDCPAPLSEQPWVPFTTDHTLTFTEGDGVVGVQVEIRDLSENTTGALGASVTIDTTPPQNLSLTVEDGSGLIATTTPTINLTASGADWMKVGAASGLATVPWVPFTTQTVLTLYSGDGETMVYARFKDDAGNESDELTVGVTLDTTAPTPPVASLPPYINTPGAEVTFSNFEGVSAVEASWEPDFLSPLSHLPTSTYSYPLPTSEEGTFTLYLRYVDAAGNRSDSRPLTTSYDGTAPTLGHAELNYGASALDSPTAVPLEVSCYDSIGNQNELTLLVTDESGSELYQGPFTPLLTLNVPNLEGEGSVTILCTDPAGNTAPEIHLPYALDRSAPTNVSLLINNGGSHTNSTSVVLTLTAEDTGSGLAQMALADTALDCDTATWELYRNTTSWVVPDDDGTKTIAACVRDHSGNVTAISESIVLDTAAPTGGMSFPSGTISQSTEIEVNAVRDDDDATHMAVGYGILDCSAQTYQAFDDTTVTVTIGREGNVSLTLCLGDNAGNITRYTETVTSDLEDPTGYFAINGGASIVTSTDLTLSIGGTSDDTTEMLLSKSAESTCDDGTWLPFSSTAEHSLDDTDGSHTVTVCLKDHSGRVAHLNSQSVILDREGPVPATFNQFTGLRLASGDTIRNQTTLPVSVHATDATTEVTDFKLSTNASCTGGTWQSFTPDTLPVTVPLQVDDGDNETREVSVLFRDTAGNESTCVSDSIVIDTQPLTLTGFTVDGGSPDPTFTRDDQITFSELEYTGSGTCAGIQISESIAFIQGYTQAFGCEASSGTYTLMRFDPEGSTDGHHPLYARVVDTAGNPSETAVAQLMVDTTAPTLSGIRIIRGTGSCAPGGELAERPDLCCSLAFDTARVCDGPQTKYTDQSQITVLIENESGASMIRFGRFKGESTSCPTDTSELTGLTSTAPALVLSFPSVGPKIVCVAVADEAGNESAIVSDTITIDQTLPIQPGITNDQIVGANHACANLLPTLAPAAVDDQFWKWEVRENGGNWTATDGDGDIIPATGDPIQFELHQDSDNHLEIRGVDQAGNRGESSLAYVEEISSTLLPTHLQIKQICNGGEYAILKDMTPTHTVYENDYGSTSDYVEFPVVPEHALLDLTTFQIKRLSAPITGTQITDGCANTELLESSIIDAACSAKAGAPALLLASPIAEACTGDPLSPYAGSVSLWVYPDPIGAPLRQGTVLGKAEGPLGDALGVTSMDALDWTGTLDGSLTGYEFRALATSTEKYNSTSYRHRLRRIEYDKSDSADTITGESYLDTVYATTAPDYHRLRGLSLWNSYSNSWLRKYNATSTDWMIRHQCTDASACDGTSTTTVATFPAASITNANGDPVSPYGTRVSPAGYYHWSSDASEEPRKNFIFVDATGDAIAYRYRNPTGSSRETVLGTGGPAEAYPPILDRGVGKVAWVHADNPRLLYQHDTYGLAPQLFRHAVDTGRPIIPYHLGGDVGEPALLYHTRALTPGVVIGYRNETGCVE